MQSTDIDCLPEEMVEMIGQHLSAPDLVRCCGVSRRWREIFGRDRLWQVHCDPQLAHYLACSKSLVRPRFVSPETSKSTLSGIGAWRLSYMRQVHLRNNWNKGNYRKCKGSIIEAEFHYIFKRIFYKDDYILEFKEYSIIVWDVHNKPTVYCNIPFDLSCNPEIGVFEVSGSNKIVILQDTLVLVYDLNLKQKSLQIVHMFSFHDSDRYADPKAELRNLIDKERQYLPVECTVVGDILMGIVRKEAPVQLHIWNLETGIKLKEQSFPFFENDYFCSSFSQNNKTLNILFDLEEFISHHRIMVHNYVYSLTKLEFYPFHTKHQVIDVYKEILSQEYYSILSDNFVAMWINNTLYVYNFLSELIYSSPYPYDTSLYRSLWRFQSKIVFKDGYTISVFNPISKLFEMEVSLTEYNQPLVSVINGRAIVLYKINKTNSTVTLIREAGDKNKGHGPIPFYYLATGTVWLVNNTRTKLMFKDDNNMIVVNFW